MEFYSWREYKKFLCECESYYDEYWNYSDHECIKTDDAIADRIIFSVDSKHNDPEKQPLIHCRIESGVEYANNNARYYKNGTEVLSGYDEEKVSTKIIFVPKIEPGKVVEWDDNDGNHGLVTEVVEFDFTFTTNDSDIDVFLPHIDTLAYIFGIDLNALTKDIRFFVHTKGQQKSKLKGQKTKIKVSRKNKGYKVPSNDELKEMMSGDLAKMKKVLIDSIHVEAKTKTTAKWITMLRDTFVTVFMTYVMDDIFTHEGKNCPHVERKRKNSTRR